MRNKIFLLVVVFTICCSLMVSPKESYAAEQSARVSLPDFAVVLNGNKVENDYRKYPLFVYKGITYVPMTWYDSRLLGLESDWSQKDGFKIVQAKVTSSYVSYKINHKNASSYNATIPTYPVIVNGRTVDNANEKYPLLRYNNVIYFPLTWRFAHAFGWEYEWDPTKGLTINSSNPRMITVNLPKSAGDNGVAEFKGFFYYTKIVGSKTQVYRVPEANTSIKELVYSYDLSSDDPKFVTFETRDNELWFSYHVGGAVMGYDVYCKVGDNGKATIEHQGYLDFKSTPNGTLIIDRSVPPIGHNLYLVPTGQDDHSGKVIGDPYLYYGWHITEGSGTSYNGDSSSTIIGDDAYVLGSGESLNTIFKINLNASKTEQIITEVNSFKILNNKLYYVRDADHCLYSSNMDGSNEQKRSHHKVANWFDAIDGNVYFTVANTKGEFNLYKAESSGEDTLVLKDSLESVQAVNNKIICKLVAGEDYGVKILDKSGDVQLAITDQVSAVYAYKDSILVVSTTDKSIKLVK